MSAFFNLVMSVERQTLRSLESSLNLPSGIVNLWFQQWSPLVCFSCKIQVVGKIIFFLTCKSSKLFQLGWLALFGRLQA